MEKPIDRIMEESAKKKFGLFMIHGFSGSSEEFGDLDKFFKNKGVAVKVPMLLGHGTTIEDLSGHSPEDWLEQIGKELEDFSNKAENIFLSGLSFGGDLAISIAEKNKNIKGIILLGAVIYFYNHRLLRFFIPFLKFFKKYYKKRINPKHFFDPEAIGRRKAYSLAPLKNVEEMLIFIDERVKKGLSGISQPALIMHSVNDKAVRPESAKYIFENIGSKIKTLKWIGNSHHNLVIDKPRQEVFQAMYDFMVKNI